MAVRTVAARGSRKRTVPRAPCLRLSGLSGERKGRRLGEACTPPGVPGSRDALKGWSCSKRRDFSDLLSMVCCPKGRHTGEKPPEPVKPEVETAEKKEPSESKPKCGTTVSKPLNEQKR